MATMAKLGPSFADKIVADLVCPGCQGFLLPPILQCVNGHCVCTPCREKMFRCAVCQEGFTNVRCLPLETLAEHYHLPCIYNCGQKVRLVNMQDHEASCPQRKFSCKIGKCSWEGALSELPSHVSRKHPVDVITMGKAGSFSRKWNGHYVKLAIHENKNLFWYHLIQDNTKPKYFRAFQYIGPASNAQNFEYSFRFTFPDNPISITFQRPTYSIRDDMITKYDSDIDFQNTVAYIMKRYKNEEKIPCITTISRVKLP
ncbi:uncharacterized protein [Anabrus simplex]|uniref:uncharacterized protein isoform X2 n=1 Tax=Anabrus simplex TaxID=316456 RepID=UPI0034DDC1BE